MKSIIPTLCGNLLKKKKKYFQVITRNNYFILNKFHKHIYFIYFIYPYNSYFIIQSTINIYISPRLLNKSSNHFHLKIFYSFPFWINFHHKSFLSIFFSFNYQYLFLFFFPFYLPIPHASLYNSAFIFYISIPIDLVPHSYYKLQWH